MCIISIWEEKKNVYEEIQLEDSSSIQEFLNDGPI